MTRPYAVTFLKSRHNHDAVLKSAAVAMRHSNQTQDSSAYDKDKHDRITAAAKRVTETFAARFDRD